MPLLEKATEFLLNYVKAYKAIGAHGVVIAEPAAGLLSPDFCGEFSSPYVKRIVDAVQDEEFIVIYHNCGDAVNRMVPQILETGAAAYHFGNAVSMEEMLQQMPGDVLTMATWTPSPPSATVLRRRCVRTPWPSWKPAASTPTSSSPPL